MLRVAAIFTVGLTGLLLLACSCPAPAPPRSASTGKDGIALDKEQAERKEWIEKAMGLGVLSKVVPGDKPELWIGPKWNSMDFDGKAKAASVVGAWCFKVPKDGSLRTEEVLFIMDNKKGNIIGTYSGGGLSLN